MFWSKQAKTPTHVAEARLQESAANLEAALADYAQTQSDEEPINVIRAAYNKVTTAYREAVMAAVAGRRIWGPQMDQRLIELRTREQQHMMEAPSGVLLPMCARPSSRGALGPHISGMEYDPTEPDIRTKHLFGVDLWAS